jgi:hypothetical protein
MKFSEWFDQFTHRFITSKGAVLVYCRCGDDGYIRLFQLSDYKVSTVSGPCVYLMPSL